MSFYLIEFLLSCLLLYEYSSVQCYPECIYRETKTLKDNDDDGGDIQLENVQKFLTANIEQRDKNIVPTILQSFKSCLTNSAYEIY